MRIHGQHLRRSITIAATISLVVAQAAVGVLLAPPAAAAISAVVERTATQVTADSLPTAQIDGVVWSQVVVGNTVYAGGSFTAARPAGSAPGVNTTPRSNLLAYDITTGVLKSGFAPVVSAQVKVVAASPDGSRLYVGGNFTTIDGKPRARIAAFDTATGALVTAFAPKLDYVVNAIAATNTTVFVGGSFNVAGGATHNRLAAFQASNGGLLSWTANANDTVNALALSPDGAKLIAGGSFTTVNGVDNYGMAAVSTSTGAVQPWLATQLVRNAGPNAAILSLRSDGTKIYGNGYVFGKGGNLEGAFAADAFTGKISWVEDCHGDTYDSFPINGALYTVSHAHYCGNIGGFPQSDPWTINQRRALAFTTEATGTVAKNTVGSYYNYAGQPSPSMIDWFPDLQVGTYTGKTQAAWSLAGDTRYIVVGGEFPKINGVAQQGLSRFAIKPLALNKQGPKLSGAAFKPTVESAPTGVKISWGANWDPDQMSLSYRVIRNGNTSTPVGQLTAKSTFWNLPGLSFTDTTALPGTTYTYRIYAVDSDGNTGKGDTVSFTTPATKVAARQASPDGAEPDGKDLSAVTLFGFDEQLAPLDAQEVPEATAGPAAQEPAARQAQTAATSTSATATPPASPSVAPAPTSTTTDGTAATTDGTAATPKP